MVLGLKKLSPYNTLVTTVIFQQVTWDNYPETLHHLLAVNAELLGVLDSELTDSESPSVETRTESDGSAVRVDLDITESLVEVGSNDDVDGLDGTRERLVKIFLGDLEFEKSTVDLVDDDDGLNTLTESLTKDSLGLHADTLDGVDDDQGTVSDTESSSDLRREIDVTGRVDQVDQELVTIDLLGDILEILLIGQMGIKGDGSGLDGDTTLLFICTCIRKSGFTSLGGRNDTSTLDKGVGQSGLSVIDYETDIISSLCSKLTQEDTGFS